MPTPLESSPLVSAIIIFLNERRFLQEAIESVFGQTYANWELLLVDDGSSDGSTAIAQRAAVTHGSRVRYLEHPDHANRGMSASRNLGWIAARGEWVAFLDGDDVWLPQKLERQISLARAHAVDMVCGDTELWFGWTGNPEDRRRDCLRGIGAPADTVVRPPEMMLRCFPLGHANSPATCSILVRRETVARVGGYEESFRGMFEDQAFLAKLYLRTPIFVSSECYDKYRMHVDSCVSRSTRAGRNDEATGRFLDWLERYLTAEEIRDSEIWRALRRAISPHRHSRLYGFRDRVRGLSADTRRAGFRW